MTKIAMIGAGSVVFSRNLTGDILSCPEFKDCTIHYMDIDRERLEVAGALCRKVATAVGANPTIATTMDRREALKGADFVINMVQIGGFDATLVDFEIPRKFGLNFTIADTTGPGGLFRALRTFPMLSGMCRDMEEVCPRAVLLNYSNPMSMNMQTVFRTSSVRGVGLCHSVQGTFNRLMRYLGEDPEKVAFTCAGINHMAFYTKIEKDGVDLYPRLFEAMAKPEIYNTNRVRFELMRRLGHFITESSEHNAEYNAHFIPHGSEYVNAFNVPIDEYLRRCDGIVDDFERLKTFSASSEPMPTVCRSHEYGSLIMQAMVNGKPTVIYGNMPNRGVIENLPADAIVEGPTLVDRSGLRLAHVGALPPQLVGYMQPHIVQHELFIRAAMEGRRDHVYQACMFDPLTAATLPLDKIVEMCDELILAHGDALPKLDAPTLVPTSGKVFKKVEAKELRRSWDAAQEQSEKECIQEWRVLGTFPRNGAAAKERPSTPLEATLAQRGDGSVDLRAEYRQAQVAAAGGAAKSVGPGITWGSASAGRRGYVDFSEVFGTSTDAIGYAYAEVEADHARETVLTYDANTTIRIWLNGKEIVSAVLSGRYRSGRHRYTVALKEGVNRLLVRLDGTQGTTWGFGASIARANF
jgi:alpha-galactosidase